MSLNNLKEHQVNKNTNHQETQFFCELISIKLFFDIITSQKSTFCYNLILNLKFLYYSNQRNECNECIEMNTIVKQWL